MIAQPKEPVLLTICVPSYNRGDRVYALVIYLLEHVIRRHSGLVELLVVNNASTDDTRELLEPLQGDGLRLVNRDRHLPSAEANMYASMDMCNGRFIWFHGDDDIPVPQTVDYLLGVLADDDVDLFITNSVSIDDSGVILADRLLKINRSYLDLNGRDMVFACGLLHMLAGISSVVVRKSMADVTIAQAISHIQEIYSHVVWLIRCFGRARVRIISRPLVYYRTDEPIKTFRHFKKYAKRRGIGDHYIWSFGLIGLLNYLLDAGDLTGEDIGRIYDGRRDGSRFRMIDELVFQVYMQIMGAMRAGGARNRVSLSEMRGAMELFWKVDLFLFDTIVILKEIVALQNAKYGSGILIGRGRIKALCKKFEKTFFAQSEDNFYRPLVAGRLSNYRIYRTPAGFVALSDAVHHRRGEVLSYIDPLEEYPDILVGDQLAVVESRIVKAVGRERMSGSEDSQPIEYFGRKLEVAIGRVAEDVHAIRTDSHRICGVRVQEVEIFRQGSWLLRLLTYQFLWPLRWAWPRLAKRWNRLFSRRG